LEDLSFFVRGEKMKRSILNLVVPVLLSEEFSEYVCKITLDCQGWRVSRMRVELRYQGTHTTLLYPDQNERWQPREKIILDEGRIIKIMGSVKHTILLLDELMFHGSLAEAWEWDPETPMSSREPTICPASQPAVVAM